MAADASGTASPTEGPTAALVAAMDTTVALVEIRNEQSTEGREEEKYAYRDQHVEDRRVWRKRVGIGISPERVGDV